MTAPALLCYIWLRHVMSEWDEGEWREKADCHEAQINASHSVPASDAGMALILKALSVLVFCISSVSPEWLSNQQYLLRVWVRFWSRARSHLAIWKRRPALDASSRARAIQALFRSGLISCRPYVPPQPSLWGSTKKAWEPRPVIRAGTSCTARKCLNPTMSGASQSTGRIWPNRGPSVSHWAQSSAWQHLDISNAGI